MSDRDLLAQLSRLESVEAVAVGDGDHIAETVPEWCELVLNLEDDRGTRAVHLTRHDAELIIEVLFTTLHPHTNKKSAAQRIWQELDNTMDFLMDDEPEEEDKATARALAFALACIGNPYTNEPDTSEIRAIAVERWEARQ